MPGWGANSITVADELTRGRDASDRLAWADAFAHLAAADRARPLAADDLDRLAIAAFLSDQEQASMDIWQRAHNAFLSLGDEPRAVRTAIHMAMGLVNAGEFARAGGWVARARRLLDDGQRDCVELGYLLVPAALQSLMSGDLESASAAFRHVMEIADRFRDRDLQTLGRLGYGQSLIALGDAAGGVALLDEIMVAVTSGEVSPMIAGTVYCAVIEACHGIFDLRRAQEWTAALNRWCEAQPGLVAFRGNCLVYRAEIMQLHGAWADALAEAHKARECLCSPRSIPSSGRSPCPGSGASGSRGPSSCAGVLTPCVERMARARCALRGCPGEGDDRTGIPAPGRQRKCGDGVQGCAASVRAAWGRARPGQPRPAIAPGCTEGNWRSVRARGAGPAPGCEWQEQSRDRDRARHQREDGGAPRKQHLHQARFVNPSCRHRVRVRARIEVGRYIEMPIPTWATNWVLPSMRNAPGRA